MDKCEFSYKPPSPLSNPPHGTLNDNISASVYTSTPLPLASITHRHQLISSTNLSKTIIYIKGVKY